MYIIGNSTVIAIPQISAQVQSHFKPDAWLYAVFDAEGTAAATFDPVFPPPTIEGSAGAAVDLSLIHI